MKYSSFNTKQVNTLKEPMFFGENVNVSRYDQQKYQIFEKLIEKQLSFFWRPEEVDITKDRLDFAKLEEHQQHIFLSNLKYQILLDSVQGRSPNVAFLPIVSIPELETWIETWAFSETIHSRSYTHIIRGITSNMNEIFEDITKNDEIVKRAANVSQYYDDLIEHINYYTQLGEGNHTINGKVIEVSLFELKKKLYLAMISVNVLEAIRFYVSFACSFAFAEQKIMEGNAKIIKLIARDEALHLTGTQHILKYMAEGKDDPEMKIVAEECREQAIKIFRDSAEQEKDWSRYLFKDGSIIGLNIAILNEYVEYITDNRLKAINFNPIYGVTQNPLPWMDTWLDNSNVQVAPQETEITSYLTGSINQDVSSDTFSDLNL